MAKKAKQPKAKTPDASNIAYLDMEAGQVTIELLPQLAPKHVERVKTLIQKRFYDGTPFHRVIEGFMVQGGDPTGTGQGGSQLPDLKAEFSKTTRFSRGIVAAARTQNPDSANSQFFIMLESHPSLDGQYTIWGQVTSGMKIVDTIKKGSGSGGMVTNPDRIIRMRLATDAAE